MPTRLNEETYEWVLILEPMKRKSSTHDLYVRLIASRIDRKSLATKTEAR